jgi:hypothetical protein
MIGIVVLGILTRAPPDLGDECCSSLGRKDELSRELELSLLGRMAPDSRGLGPGGPELWVWLLRRLSRSSSSMSFDEASIWERS